ncbi:MAG TPA: N-acetyl-gamma-glutamyl-phosphate reductase [Firmicutes bacterium]|nr:N-acetyl-gamma-glutamyl-phosphate reductase [Bacillota bacterium]
MLKIGIIGATGYTGRELVRILVKHPGVEISLVTSESYAGQKYSQVYPEFKGVFEQVLEKYRKEALSRADVLFSALPHGSSREKVPELLEAADKVIDLSGDYRLKDASLYAAWYGYEREGDPLLKESVYGLPEINRENIAGARLVANPGCYPTSALIGLKPLLTAGVAVADDIIIDAKSGVTGAGRTPKLPYHYPEMNDNFKAYKVTGHQHTPEIEEQAAGLAGEKALVRFTPHLLPLNRGILSTIYLKLKEPFTEEDLFTFYHACYDEEPFVRILDAPGLPETRYVMGTNFCDVSLRLDDRTGRVIVITAIDNLVKGAAGQAVQNLNILMGWPETEGLLML